MKEKVIHYGIIVIFFALLVSLAYLLPEGPLIGFAVFSDSSQGDFDSGTYADVEFNGSAVVLFGSNLTGNFTSQVFDATADAAWNSLSWVGGVPTVEFLFSADGSADVWYSVNSGVDWTLAKDDYTGADGNGATSLAKNSSGGLFILFEQDVWISNNNGVDWTKINNDFNPSDSNAGVAIEIDSNDNVYVIDTSEEVFSSSDSGVSFASIRADINGGGGNIRAMVVNSSDALFVVDNTADVWYSVNSGVDWTLAKDDYNGGVTNDANGLVVNSSDDLFILHGKDVWYSVNSGVDWTLANDDFGSGSSGLGKVIHVDGNDYLYIIDGSEDVYRSTDSGTSFSVMASNLNGANGNVFALTSLSSPTSLSFQVRNCSSSDCTDAGFASATLASLDLTSRYFQYQILFETPDSSVGPYFENVSIDYDLSNSAPTITLAEPQTATLYLTNESLSLNFSVSDSDANLGSCWYNLDGVDNVTLAGCANSTFDVAGDGSYALSIFANDTSGLESSDSASFSVDVAGVSLSLIEPSGSKTSRTEIPITYAATGNSLVCWYNVKTSVGGEVLGNTTLENCSDSTFDVSADGDFVLNLYANNTFGSSANESSLFSVDTSTSGPPPTSPPGGGSSGGGGGLTILPKGDKDLKVGFSDLEDVVLKRGTSQEISLVVTNTDFGFLNHCSLEFSGTAGGWFTNEQEEGLTRGEKVTYEISLNIPEDAEPGSYSSTVTLNCDEGVASTVMSIVAYRDVFSPTIFNYERIGNELVVSYTLEEFSGETHEILISFSLLDFDGVPRFNGEKTISLSARQVLEDIISFDLPKDSFGEFNFVALFSDGVSEVEVMEVVFLPSGGGVTGLAISDDNKRVLSIVGVVVLLVLLGFVVYWLLRKFRRKTKRIHYKKSKRKLLELEL